MQSQQTLPAVIKEEKHIISRLLGLRSHDGIILNDTGWDSRVYVMNEGEVIFKFPRSDNVKKQYEPEIAGYKLVAGIASEVKTPQVKWEHPSNDYFGYEGIVGEALDTAVKELPRDVKARVGSDLGKFLKQFHALEMTNMRTMTIQKEIEEFQHKYELGLQVIEKSFSDNEQQKIEKLIEEDLPSGLINLGADMVLCHGDLGYWNIVYGTDGCIGVIDFGDIGYYDKSKDFIGMADDEVLNMALHEYGDNTVLREKIALRKKVLAILDLPFFIGKSDMRGIQDTVNKIRSAIA